MSKMENVVLEERKYKGTVKGHVFNSYRRTNRDKLFGVILAEEKEGVFYLKTTLKHRKIFRKAGKIVLLPKRIRLK